MASPNGLRPRRESVNSISATSQIDKDQLALALDKIHTTASQSETLTTFHDFGPPPGTTPAPDTKGGAGDLVQQGLTGLYSRLKEAVGAVSKPATHDADDASFNDAASKKSSSTIHTLGKLPAGSHSRSESLATAATFGSAISAEPLSTSTTSPGAGTGEPASHVPPSSKNSSLTNVTAKSASSSGPTFPKIVRTATSSAADPTVASVTVGAFREPTKGVTHRAEESASRHTSRRSISKPSDAPHPAKASASLALYDVDPTQAVIGDRIVPPKRSRREDSMSVDGSMDTPLSPTKNGSFPSLSVNSPDPRVESSSRLSASDRLKKPVIIDRLSRTTKSAAQHSTTSSMEPGTAEPSPISTSAHNSVYHESFAHDQKPEHLRSGKLRIPGTTVNEGAPDVVNARLEQMRKQVLSKEFWMADETCKECFLCGDAFSAFRRKHHCRACGCIFDSKCTVTIPGQKVGVTGNLRVCKNCLGFINRRYDSGSDDSADDSYLPQIFRSNTSKPSTVSTRRRADDEVSIVERPGDREDGRSAATPMMAIPATRRIGDPSNRNSAILEIAAPQLSRPSSSRSLRSLASGRPQSSGHKRHASKHNLLGRFKAGAEASAPFRKSITEEMSRKSKLPAFHDDNIIDPELAPYMSDESSDDEQMSIFATMASNDNLASSSFDHDRPGFGPFGGAGRSKLRHRGGEKSISGLSFTTKGADEHSGPLGALNHSRPNRRRNLSTTSTSQHHMRSPRPKSGIFKAPQLSTEALSVIESSSVKDMTLTRSNSSAVRKDPARRLKGPAMDHVRKLYRQLLEDNDVQNTHIWEKALVPLFVKCAEDVDPEPPNDQMDIRHYTKMKKIPGGKPSDSSYVSGVVFTKKLALKSMPRSIVNPRVVIVSFALEYSRQQQHFMSLEPVIAQEREFLRMLVNRIIALRPQVLIAQKGISGLALQFLSEANIAVAYNVKPSVIAAVARCIGCPIISSTDMLNLPTSVGICESFEVKTYINSDFKGRKKTYIFISGCVPEFGCTVAIRGASSDVLSRVKKVTEFMVYVVYNLKLEACLLRDQGVKEIGDAENVPGPPSPSTADTSQLQDSAESCKECQALTDPLVNSVGDPVSQREENMSPVHDSTVDGPRPDPITTEKLISLHHSHTRGPNETQVPEDVPPPTFYSDMVAKYESRILSISPFVKFAQPYLLMKAREQERRLVYLKRLRDRDMIEEQTENEKAKPQKFQLLKPDMVHDVGRKAPRQMMEVLHAVHDAEYDKALYNYRTQTKAWETYLQGSLDLFDPYAHQNITVLYSMVCTETSVPCAEPELITICFYDEAVFEDNNLLSPDCTLGSYLEEMCDSIDDTCQEHGCDRPMSAHHRTYVHDQARVTFFIQRGQPRPVVFHDDGTPVPDEQPIMWNYCKQCDSEIGYRPMSSSTWKYSFAKYLELSFWGKGLKLDSTSCQHDRQLDHRRYFYLNGCTIRVHYDPIDLLELVVPRTRITWKVDHDLRLKNDIFQKHEEKWIKYISSIKTRIKGIRIDSVLPEKAEACRAELDRLLKAAQEIQPVLIKNLQDAYMSSKYYEVIPMNGCVRMMLEQVSEWDAAFAQFESDFLSDKDVRQLTMIQLRKMFSDNDSQASLATTESSGVATMASESEDKSTPPTSQNTSAEFEEKTSPQHESEAETSAVPSLAVSTEGLPIMTENQAKLEQQAEQMLERVEPLDLATPASPQAVRSSLNTPKLTPESSTDEPTSTTPSMPSAGSATPAEEGTPLPVPVTAATDGSQTPKQISDAPSSETVRAIDNIEKPSETLSRALQERMPSRKAGLTVSPPMLRALSQPAGILPRTMSAISKVAMSKDAKAAAAATAAAADAAIGADLHKVSSELPVKVDKKFADRIGLTALKNRKSGQSSIPRFVHKKKESKVSTLAKHFEQLSREFEKERQKDRKQRAAKLHNTRAFLPRTNTRATVQVYDNVKQAIEEVGPTEEEHTPEPEEPAQEPPKTTAEAAAIPADTPVSPHPVDSVPTMEPTSQTDDAATEAETDIDQKHDESAQASDDEGASDTEQSLEDILPDVETIAEHLEPGSEVPKELQKDKKSTLMKMLSNFWAERSASGWSPLEFPVAATDHVLRDSNIVVREDEPSSLVAYALDTETYKNKLAASRQQLKMAARRAGSAETDETVHRSGVSDSASIMVNDDDEELNLIRAQATHIKLQFEDGAAKFQCKIYFAEAFDALRRKCGVSERVIESLSRCVKWDSKGGKTKSVFLKTLDDRLVMKSLSPVEMTAFVNFAPTYFSHMSDALFHDMPSAIAKMLGFFHVSIKNSVTGTETKLDLLLMENLFYDRTDARKFDLKGSMRNRKVQSTGEQNEVLLDENMVEFIYESPLFAREHSKKTLRQSVFNDTLFLARQDVMDYSLMVAVDEPRRELVVGIIDCIRTYTWDKKLESWIKDRGFAGGGRNRPTVTSPKEYKSRFREAMNRYILQAPNPWHQFEAPHPLAPMPVMRMGMESGSQLIIPPAAVAESSERRAREGENGVGVDMRAE